MKRPQFFIDLERELAGELDLEPIPEPEHVRVEAVTRVFYQPVAYQAQLEPILRYCEKAPAIMAQAPIIPGIDEMTATGAMIAADYAQYRAAMLAQCAHPQLEYMAQRQAQASQGLGGPYAFGSIWDALGGGFR
jgi:hypothetical protein